ncbi:MAG: hypothetical protein ACOYL6_18210 [Bacteriovoracaceae bacterium]
MKFFLVTLLTLGSISAFAGETVKCQVIDMPNLGSDNPTTFDVDVDKNVVDVKLAEFQGEEGYKLSVNVLKRSLDQNYILDASIVSEGNRTIFARAFGKTLPLTLQIGNMNDKTEEASWLTMTCGL